eukprot:COSAG04_NODE_171_length_21611_cov_4.302808_11_plen_483_part_00
MDTERGVVENPLADEDGEASNSGDIEARLKDGTLTAEQAVVLQERQMELMRVEMQRLAAAQLDSVVEGGGVVSPLAATVRGVVARLTETPANFHQATVYFLAAGGEDALSGRAPLLYVGSLAMVGLQSITAVGVFAGTIIPSCATSDQCSAGMFCLVGMIERCDFCGGSAPLPLATEGACTFETTIAGGKFTAADAACTSRNNAQDPNHVGFNLTLVAEVCTAPYSEGYGLDGGGLQRTYPNIAVASWCEACVRNDGTVDPMNGLSLITGNLAAMNPFDHVAFVFAAFTVAFTVIGELKDIELCSIAVAHAGDKLSKGWRIALGFLLWIRRWVFLPALVMNVPQLVLLKGGDALSVCLNTVAILFLCDIDNIAFTLVLGERVRARMENEGRVELGDAEASALARTKAVHVLLLVVAVLGVVWSGDQQQAVFLTFFAFLLGGMAEEFVPGASAAETAMRVAKVLGVCLLGSVGWIVLVVVASL